MTIPGNLRARSLRVLHLCLACFYIDGYGYQENLLPKYHKKAGHEVKILASLVSFDDFGELTLLPHSDSYVNEESIPVVRLDYWPSRMAARMRIYRHLMDEINEFKPDVIFAHGPQFLDALRVARYVRRNPNVSLYVDNHADFSNSGQTWVSRTLLHRGLWGLTARALAKRAERMFGVLPARAEFLTKVYRVPRNKVSFLPMGADDDLLSAVTPATISAFRRNYDVAPGDFLIVTGGKIDLAKEGTLNLMAAVKKLRGRRVHLIVFGTVVPELRRRFELLVDDDRVKFAGWLDNPQSTVCFGAADLVVFPGRHSVYWEQVCAIGTPLMVTGRHSSSHIDMGGNCSYLPSDSVEDIERGIQHLLDEPSVYRAMVGAAQSPERLKFSYRVIADESIRVGAR